MKQTLILSLTLCFNLLIHAQSASLPLCPQTQAKQEQYAVHFEPNGSDLSPDEKDELLNFLSPLQGQITALSLTGHTDGDGDEAYNIALSLARAESVRSFLSSAGFDVGTYSYKGESDPLASNSTHEGKALNRRVEVLVALTNEDGQGIGSLEELLETWMPEEQKFCIDNRKDTTFMCADGTVIRIPAFSFSNLIPDQCVQITVIEALDVQDMVFASLSTTSDGNALESGGTIYIDASQNGEKLTLLPEKQTTLFLPAYSERDDMKVFYADDHMNWQADDLSQFNFLEGQRLLALTTFLEYEVTWQRCPFFFCRISRVFEPKLSRRVLLNGSIRNSKYKSSDGFSAEMVEEMMAQYGVENLDALSRVLEREQKQIDKLSYYVAPITQYGWVNCDRFLGFTNLTTAVAECNKPFSSSTYMVFPDYNCVMNPSYGGSEFLWANVPVGAEIQVVSVLVDDGKPMLALYSGEIHADDNLDLEYINLAPEEMKQAIAKFIR